MESLTAQLSALTISSSPPNSSLKTGLIHHPTMLLHSLDYENMDKSQKHVENPKRLKSILDRLKETNLADECEVITEFSPCPLETVELVHPKEYIDYVSEMWDENCTKKCMYYFDTYYNKFTAEAARLAVAAGIIALENVVAKKWKNAFLPVRPPGHHAGTRGKIQGFCIYNNAAILAKFAQKHLGVKKVLILDWDVHHGDSTQHFLYNDGSVLYVSLHRFDEGSFYPGTTGDIEKQGDGDGLGFNVNFPWNTTKKSIVGDHEYIYAFERALFPIMQKFNPDLVLVSSGFDSGRGDPLGGLDLTPDGYAYMTRRLQSLASGQMIVLLEGGYNLKTIADSAEAVLRVLLGEEIPVKNSLNNFTLQELYDHMRPSKLGLDHVEKALEVYKPYHEHLLTDESLLNFQKTILSRLQRNISNDSDFIAGGHADDFIARGDKMYKKAKKGEIEFYQDLVNPNSKFAKENELLAKLTPKFYGVEEIEGETYIVMENLFNGMEKASIIDAKLGAVTWTSDTPEIKKKLEREKGSRTTSAKVGYRLSGVIFKDPDGKVEDKRSKAQLYYDMKVDDLPEMFRRLLKSNKAEKENGKAIDGFVSFAKNLLEWFKNHSTRSFVASSIVFLVDNTTEKWNVRYIDFAHVEEVPNGGKDKEVIFALRNLVQMLEDVLFHSMGFD